MPVDRGGKPENPENLERRHRHAPQEARPARGSLGGAPKIFCIVFTSIHPGRVAWERCAFLKSKFRDDFNLQDSLFFIFFPRREFSVLTSEMSSDFWLLPPTTEEEKVSSNRWFPS